MKTLHSPKRMASPWRDTVTQLPSQLKVFVQDIRVADANGGVAYWSTADWMCQGTSGSFASNSIGKQRSIVHRMEQVNASMTTVYGTASPQPASPGGGVEVHTDTANKKPCPHEQTRELVDIPQSESNTPSTSQPVDVGASPSRRIRQTAAANEAVSVILFGHTEEGHAISIQVEDFLPWIHVQFPSGTNDDDVHRWLNHIYVPSNDKQMPLRFERVRMRPFFGVTPDPADLSRPRLYDYHRFYFATTELAHVRQFAKDINSSDLNGVWVDHDKMTPLIRFQQQVGFGASTWITIQDWNEARQFVTNNQVEVRCRCRDLLHLTNEESQTMTPKGQVTATMFTAQLGRSENGEVLSHVDVASTCNEIKAVHVAMKKSACVSTPCGLFDGYVLADSMSEQDRSRWPSLCQDATIGSVADEALDGAFVAHYCFLVDSSLSPSEIAERAWPFKVAVPSRHLLVNIVPFEWMALLALRDLLFSSCVDVVLHHDAFIDGILQWHARVNIASQQFNEQSGMASIGSTPLLSSIFTSFQLRDVEGVCDIPQSLFPRASTQPDCLGCRHPTPMNYLGKMAFVSCGLERVVCKSGKEEIEAATFIQVPGVNWIDTGILTRRFKDLESYDLEPVLPQFEDTLRQSCMEGGNLLRLVETCQERCHVTRRLYEEGDLSVGLVALSHLTGLSVHDYIMKSNMSQFWSLVGRKSFQMGVIVDQNRMPMRFNVRGGSIFSDLEGLYTTAIVVSDFQSHYLRATIDGNICPSTMLVPFDEKTMDRAPWLAPVASPNGKDKIALVAEAVYNSDMSRLPETLSRLYGSAEPLALDYETNADIDFLVPRSSAISRLVDPRLVPSAAAVTSNHNDSTADDYDPTCHFVCPPQFQSKGRHSGKAKAFDCEGVIPSIFRDIASMRANFDELADRLREQECINGAWQSEAARQKHVQAKAMSTATKLTGNVCYGIMMYVCPPAAQATTDFGRRLNLFARHAIIQRWRPPVEIHHRMAHFFNAAVETGRAQKYRSTPNQRAFHYFSQVYGEHHPSLPSLEDMDRVDDGEDQRLERMPTHRNIMPTAKNSYCTRRWPVSVAAGHTDSIFINIFFLIPSNSSPPTDDTAGSVSQEEESVRLFICDTEHHYTRAQRQLAVDIGEDMGYFITRLLRKANLEMVTMQFEKMMHPFIQSRTSKISYAGIQWRSAAAPVEAVPKMVQMGRSRRLPMCLGKLIEDSVTLLLTKLSPSSVHKLIMTEVQNMVQSALSPSSVDEVARFSVCETIHMRKRTASPPADIVSPHVAANEVLRAYSPRSCYRFGSAIRYVHMVTGASKTVAENDRLVYFGGVRLRASVAGCLSVRQMRMMEHSGKIKNTDDPIADPKNGSDNLTGTGAANHAITDATRGNRYLRSRYWIDHNQMRMFRVDGALFLQRCTTALQDVLFAMGDNDGKGWINPGQTEALSWSVGCLARSAQPPTHVASVKGKNGQTSKVPTITHFLKKK